jgi:hypothetical protein
MRITTAAAADGAGAAAAPEAAAEAAHGGEGASGHRPSPAGVPGAGEGATIEVTSSIKFLVLFFFAMPVFFSPNRYHIFPLQLLQ